jgi:hypothetical protein
MDCTLPHRYDEFEAQPPMSILVKHLISFVVQTLAAEGAKALRGPACRW